MTSTSSRLSRRPRRLARMVVCVASLSVAAGGLGCATSGGGGSGGGATPDYASDAQTNLKRGTDALESKNYEEAEKYFDYVNTKYPFLDASKEAELRLADTEYLRENYSAARDRYQNFVKLHPTHPKVDYAAFRAAMTHKEEIASDYFFMPPSIEKDQAEVKSAYKALGDFVRQYPTSNYFPEAQKQLSDARRRLAEHELYVAAFYRKRHRWQAVAWRLESLAQNYPGPDYDERAFFGLYEAYRALKDPEKAKGALQRLVERMPGTPAAERAQRLLGSS